MKFDPIDPDRGPTPQQLGAYADGELGAADREAVDAWLRRHPEHAAEVEALRNLAQLWRDTPPPQPRMDAWSAVRDKIETRLRERSAGHGRETTPQQGRTQPRGSLRFGLAVAAAAVLALVILSKGHNLPTAAAEEPYPVINADDVAILSISGGDCDCLVCAQPPVGRIDERDLATPDDVLVLNLEPHQDDGAVPDLHFEDKSPMFITPPPDWNRDP